VAVETQSLLNGMLMRHQSAAIKQKPSGYECAAPLWPDFHHLTFTFSTSLLKRCEHKMAGPAWHYVLKFIITGAFFRASSGLQHGNLTFSLTQAMQLWGSPHCSYD